METKVLRPTKQGISEAAKVLREGGLVAFPTETVYGPGANALNAKAVKKSFVAKGRPQDNPLIVHVSSTRQVSKLVKEVPPVARGLMRAFWPGPLTLVLKKSGAVPLAVTAGLRTVAVRMPANKVAIGLIKSARVPVAAASANVSGRPSPTDLKHVVDDLSGKVDVILVGGRTNVGVESTVVDLTSRVPVLLRPGGVTLEQLEKEIGEVRLQSKGKARSPGMKHKHYAPKARVVVTNDPKAIAAKWRKRGKRVKVAEGSASFLAKNLFRLFREADAKGFDVIIVKEVSERGIGRAVMNRLRKAESRT